MAAPSVGKNTSGEGGSLFASAGPELYRTNAFRILGLSSDSSARDISKHLERLQLAEKFGRKDGNLGLLGLEPAPSPDDVRTAAHRLRDPELRLVDELFWFWPHELGQGKSDPALAAIAAGDVNKAVHEWQKQENMQSEASMSAHNLAVLYHARALDLECRARSAALDPSDYEHRARCWREAVSRWRAILGREGFWHRFNARIKQLDDPRLTVESGHDMRGGLLRALCLINAKLAVQAAERGLEKEVEHHKEVLKAWAAGDASGLDMRALHDAMKPIRERISTLCRAAEEKEHEEPEHADQAARQLMEGAQPLLAVIDLLLQSGDPRRDGAHDAVAVRVLTSQIVFGNKTDNWAVSEQLLIEALRIVAGDATRARIERNLEVVRSNKLFDTCYFCGENPKVEAHGFEVPIHGDVHTFPVDYNTTRTTWRHSEVHVPRCEACAKRHRRYNAARILGFTMMAVFAVAQITVLKVGSDYIEGGLWGVLIAALAAGIAFSSYVTLAVSHVLNGGVKAPGAVHDYPNLAKRMKEDGWSYGSGPGSGVNLPTRTNPNWGKWLASRPRWRALFGQPVWGLALLVIIPLLWTAFTALSMPVLGFVAGSAAAAARLQRVGLVSAETVNARVASRVRGLSSQLKSSETATRREAAEAFGNLGVWATSAIPDLIEAANDQEAEVKAAAFASLARIGGNRPDVQVQLLKAAAWQTRQSSAKALGELGASAPREARPALAAALVDSDSDVRDAAAAALALIAPSPLWSTIKDLSDVNWVTRQAAAQRLGQMGAEASDAMPALVRALGDSDIDVRDAAAEALGRILPSKRAVWKAIAKLSDSDWEVRQAAARRLGEMASSASEAVAALTKTSSQDDVPDVRVAAEDALRKINGN